MLTLWLEPYANKLNFYIKPTFECQKNSCALWTLDTKNGMWMSNELQSAEVKKNIPRCKFCNRNSARGASK